MRTSVTVFSGGATTSIISTGEVKLSVLPPSDDLEVSVVENGVEVKRFFFKSGEWSRYSIIKTEL